MTYNQPVRRKSALFAVGAAVALAAGGCSAGSLGSSGGGDSTGGGGSGVTLTFLVDSGDQTVASANAMIKAFQSTNPNITIKLDTRPGGSDGDNIVKTKLSTGDMADVFQYNNGSLLQALKPETNLTPLDDQSWAGQMDKNFVNSTKGSDGKLYGGAWGSAFGGGVLYNIPIYKKLGLEAPKTWDEFMSNSAKIQASGTPAVVQTYGDTWTAQMMLLADYHNVEAQVPDFAAQYTAGKVKFATTPAALAGFEHLQAVKDAGLLNKDFASAKMTDGVKMVATGAAAQYPQIGAVAPNIETVAPGKSADVGFFALPGKDAASNGMTVWPGNGLYIPKSVDGDKLDAAKKFIAFAQTQAGCDAYSTGSPPQGPFLSKACKLPAQVSQVAKDTQAYVDSGKATPALEFKSPIKGPALEQIMVQVGTGQVDALKGAQLYDQDVTKQAQQLGLPGWG